MLKTGLSKFERIGRQADGPSERPNCARTLSSLPLSNVPTLTMNFGRPCVRITDLTLDTSRFFCDGSRKSFSKPMNWAVGSAYGMKNATGCRVEISTMLWAGRGGTRTST